MGKKNTMTAGMNELTKVMDIMVEDFNPSFITFWEKKLSTMETTISRNAIKKRAMISSKAFAKKCIFLLYCIHFYKNNQDYTRLVEITIPALNDRIHALFSSDKSILNDRFYVNWDLVSKTDVSSLCDRFKVLENEEDRLFILSNFCDLDEEIDNKLTSLLLSCEKRGDVYIPFENNEILNALDFFSFCRFLECKMHSVLRRWNDIFYGTESKWIYNEEGDAFKGLPDSFAGIVLVTSTENNKLNDGLTETIKSALNKIQEDGEIFIFDSEGIIDKRLDIKEFLVNNNLLAACFNSHRELGFFLSYPQVYVLKKKRYSKSVLFRDAFSTSKGNEYSSDNESLFLNGSGIKDLNYDFHKVSFLGIFQKKPGDNIITLDEVLKEYIAIPHSDKTGRIFTSHDFSSGFDSFECDLKKLKTGEVCVENYIKVSEPVIVLPTLNGLPKFTFVPASEEVPVFFRKPYKEVLPQGKTIYRFPVTIYSIKTNDIFPLFLCLASFKKIIRLDEGFFSIDPYMTISQQEYYLHCCSMIIPTIYEDQVKAFESEKLLWNVMNNKLEEQKRLSVEKEWLNETHIRNIKHKLRDEMTPLQIGIGRLRDYFNAHQDAVSSKDIIGSKTHQTIGQLLDSLYRGVYEVGNSLSQLTESKKAGAKEVVNVKDFLQQFVIENPHYPIFLIANTISPEIEISASNFRELLNCIVENAVRHGFEGKVREDSQIRIYYTIDENGNCVIEISNNGFPMSDRAKVVYFERGSYAGLTGNSGIGGARIKEIAEESGGRVKLSFASKEFPVSVVVTLPCVNY